MDAGAPQDPGLALFSDAEVARRLAADHTELLTFLADRLQGALPRLVRVQRRGLFNRGEVDTVTVMLGSVHYELSQHHGILEASTGAVAGGVVLHHEPLPIDQWVAGLLGGLAELAAGSAEVRAALSQLA